MLCWVPQRVTWRDGVRGGGRVDDIVRRAGSHVFGCACSKAEDEATTAPFSTVYSLRIDADLTQTLS
jgi:hypothetical protein